MAVVQLKKLTFEENLSESDKETLHKYDFYYDGEKDNEGYVVANKLDQFKSDLKYSVSSPKILEDLPPVIYKDNSFDKPFHKYVAKYTKLKYFDVDPTFFLSICFCILFGIMFGDIGQGLVLILIGLFYKKKDSSIFLRLGIFSIIFGWFYGSIFGNEEIIGELMHEHGLHYFRFGLMERANTKTLLLDTAALGVFMTIITMVLNIIDKFREKKPQEAIYGPHGIAGLMLFGSVLLSSIYSVVFGLQKPVIIVVAIIVLISLIMIYFGNGKEMEIVGESVLSLTSAAMNFIIVGCFALAHATLMFSVFEIAEMFEPIKLVIIILGNALVMYIEATEVMHQCIHLVFGSLIKFMED